MFEVVTIPGNQVAYVRRIGISEVRVRVRDSLIRDIHYFWFEHSLHGVSPRGARATLMVHGSVTITHDLCTPRPSPTRDCLVAGRDRHRQRAEYVLHPLPFDPVLAVFALGKHPFVGFHWQRNAL